jgi:hypothetical protein
MTGTESAGARKLLDRITGVAVRTLQHELASPGGPTHG